MNKKMNAVKKYIIPRSPKIFIGLVTVGGICYVLSEQRTDRLCDAIQKTKIANPDFKYLQGLGDSVLEDMKDISIYDSMKKNVKFYTTNEIKIQRFGSLQESNSAMKPHIGLPISFDKTFLENFKLETMKCNGEDLHNNAEQVDVLKQSLNMSEDAKKFAIAHSIFLLTQNENINKVLIIMCYGMMLNLMVKNELLKKNRLQSFALILLGLSGLSLFYVLLYMVIRSRTDISCDKQAVALGPQYYEGAIEFMDKIMKRNKALRELTPNGKEYFSEDGLEMFYTYITSNYKERREKILNMPETAESSDNK